MSHEILNPRAALLSNYEVLELLKELEADHLARAKTAVRIKKEEDASGSGLSTLPPGGRDPGAMPEISEGFRTIQVEGIKYLSADYLPSNVQTPESITALTKKLKAYDLTKAEKLQIVNLAPKLPVELYVVIEEMEDRFGDKMEEIIDCVKSTLHEAPGPSDTAGATFAADSQSEILVAEETLDEHDEELQYPSFGDAEGEQDELFDDLGDGAGVEGDLEMEE